MRGINVLLGGTGTVPADSIALEVQNGSFGTAAWAHSLYIETNIAATNSVTQFFSPLAFQSQYWTGSMSAIDVLSFGASGGTGANPYMSYVWQHTGTSGTPTLIAPVTKKTGLDSKGMRERAGLTKTKNKMSETFDAHCVDSWVLANSHTGGHMRPDNEQMLLVTPIRLHRRQLHRLQPEVGGKRKRYGGTRSLGFTRGSLVRHPKWGIAYVGGELKGCISLHSLENGKRLCQNAKPADVKFLANSTWRTRLLPALKGEVSVAA